MIISGSYDGTIKIWDANSGSNIRTLAAHTEGVSSVSYSLDYKRIVSGSYANGIKIWDL